MLQLNHLDWQPFFHLTFGLTQK